MNDTWLFLGQSSAVSLVAVAVGHERQETPDIIEGKDHRKERALLSNS